MPELKEQRRKMPPMSARAMFQPETFDADNNTIEVVFATETPVFRNVWGEKYFEVLVCGSSNVRLERMNQGGPVVDTHSTWRLSDQFGVVEKAWIDGSQCRALVRLSTTEGDKEVVEKIKSGILRNVSVQYRIYAYEMDDAADNQTPTMRVTDWEPLEISFVPVPADMNSGVRSVQDEPNEVIFTRKKNTNSMSKPKEGVGTETEARTETPAAPVAAPAPAAPAAPAEGGDEQTRAATAAERNRVTEITSAVRSVKLPDEFLDKLIKDGTNLDAARKLIIDEMAKGETAQPAVQVGITVRGDEGQKRQSAIIDGLALRSGILLEKDMKPEAVAHAREFRTMSLFDLAKDCLTRAGIDFRGWDKMEIIGRAFTSSSSDFPVLLEGTNRRVLLSAYNIVADTWRRFCAVGSVSDFREHKRLRMGSFSRLDTVAENGEFKTKKITDAEAEKVSASTFGNIINVTRVMIINDDLAGFTRLASGLGRAAARSIEIDVYALLASNPTMGDGIALFHADHGNLVTGSAMSVNSFDELRVKMASQKDKDENDFLDMRPSVLLCGIAKGGEAKVINDAQYDPDTANKLQRPNKVRGLFSDIVDTPRITGNEYYAFADPNQEPVLEVNFLDGNQTPYMESQQGFTVDGVKWKVRHDYGVDAVGWRGAVKNPGA